MWSSTTMDTSINSRGGFLDTTESEDPSDKKVERLQNIVPVTIDYLLNAPDVNELKLESLPIRTFEIVAIIRNIEETATRITYNVEDQTGSITAVKWLEAEKRNTGCSASTNAYFHIFGMLREQNNQRHILIMGMHPLQNLNALVTHLLEVIYVSLRSAEDIFMPQIPNSKDANGTKKDNVPMEVENSNQHGLDNDQVAVYEIIRKYNDTESGIERDDLIAKLPQPARLKINEILEFLISEGHIYTTCTDDHFKTT